ncbi:uncharacterized protein TRIADDRAFT_50795 [Trichoplax adhaerens]|uniref:Malic enzyme n=1 Tax=Trichoplax adhaerens TaxID=10228 RepID=B3S6Z9_TRIAD|nr:hypothetical protein TRIADDRAFT_50795 [Trichoplax adhaerens]EDV21481.1 hypothetical protein TRIADDRAFT_50795 [Trichoplax adhaerens]|eukprot:XP_002116081.1 hypothetical protein TRIADDRAFT_50795 [Trichoplax adhaerens]
MAFTLKERQLIGIHGLLPPTVLTQEVQVQRVMNSIKVKPNDLERFIYLMSLQDRNEKLFYRVIQDHLEELMPIIYTPVVGLAGLFISIYDKGNVKSILRSWPEIDVKAIVFTDGERILGLGDLGCYGMGIPVGKLSLYTACAGVKPSQCLPVMLDVGTDNKELLDDPFYIGIRRPRERGPAYDELIEEFMQAVVERYGETTLMQFEDFGNRNAFRLLDKFRNRFCTFNDDIQGTAGVTVAGLLGAMRITKKSLADNVFLFQGAGEAAIGIANLIVSALMEEGLAESDARKKVWLVDSKGLVVNNRSKGGINEHKQPFAHDHKYIPTLAEAVKVIKPTAIIGVAAISRAFTKEIIEDMARINENPIIFALSNPTAKSECTFEEAYQYTNGKCIFASGSPFPPITKKDGSQIIPGQGNNAYIFPGVALGVIAAASKTIPESTFLIAAKSLANQVTDEDLKQGRVYPPLTDIRKVSRKIAIDVADYSYNIHLSNRLPRPANTAELIDSFIYSTDYESFVPHTYEWPSL